MIKNSDIPSDIDFIRILWCDNANIIRAKAIYKNSDKNNDYYVGISEAQQAISSMGAVVKESGLSPVGEVQLVGDPKSFIPLPYSPGQGRMMGDMMKDGKKWDYCPRGFLSKMIKKASQEGFEVQAAFENEFYLLKREESGIISTDNAPFASVYAMDIHREIISEIVNALNNQEMEVQQYYPESGTGQQEITIKYGDAKKACDNQIAYRETVKAIAYKNGFIASFLPKIFPDQTGSGCHLHLSLWKEGNNILTNSEGEYGISKQGEQFIAGILHHLSALMAVTAPIPNSYRRIIPHTWSGAYKCWGMDNREAAVRVIKEADGKIKNFELKTIDASSNPYLALGVVIAAGIDGIKEEMELEDPIQKDPADISKKDQQRLNIKRLPSNLKEAITELRKDKIILSSLGEKLSRAYIAIKEKDIKDLDELSLEEEVELLLETY
ncbi:MAG: glutamine synthetase [Methanobacterium sp.]|nr:glutamine synthetase [Methanobacterium sp.]